MKRNTEIVCTSCGSVGFSQTVTPGSTALEFFLWGFSIVAGAVFPLLFVLLIPVLGFSIWRLSARHQACKACGQKGIIPVNSPMAQKILVHGLAPGGVAAAPAVRPTA